MVLSLLAVELGYRLGMIWQRRYHAEEAGPIGTMAGATLALLAFLLALITRMAVSRFDNRRNLVVDEANEIGTTFLRAGNLDEPYASESRALLREYVDVRLTALDPTKLADMHDRSERIQAELWSRAEMVARANAQSPVAALYIQLLNEVIDLHGKRSVAVLSSRIPGSIWFWVYVVAILTMGLVGLQSSYDEHRDWLGIVLLVLVFAAVLSLIIDLDRPQRRDCSRSAKRRCWISRRNYTRPFAERGLFRLRVLLEIPLGPGHPVSAGWGVVNEFAVVLGIATIASFLTYLGAPAAERLEVPDRVVNGALQFAAGIIVALVGLSLLPPAVRSGSPLTMTVAFVCGGTLFVLFDYLAAKKLASTPKLGGNVVSVGLFAGILVDMLIDGIMIGLGSTMTLATGLLVALSLGISAAPMAFVAIATARRRGVSKERRRLLSFLFFLCVLVGAMFGYLVLRNQSLEFRLILVALASGFLVTVVTQSIIPEANWEGEPSLAGLLFIGGIALYALLSVTIK